MLWRAEGLIRNPLVTLDGVGRVVSVETCEDPDHMAHTEFWAGVLVADFPANYLHVFEEMCVQMDVPLPELLKTLLAAAPANPVVAAAPGVLVVISGLDYDTLCLTPQSQIRKL